MKKKKSEDFKLLDKTAKEITKKHEWQEKVTDIISQATNPIKNAISLKNNRAEIARSEKVQEIMDQGAFHKNAELMQTIDELSKPYQAVRSMLEEFDRSKKEIEKIAFESLVQPEEYYENIIAGFQETTDIIKSYIGTDGNKSLIEAVATGIDTSWLHIQPAWAIDTKDFLNIQTIDVEPTAFTTLVKLEQDTSLILGYNETITSIASQLASISNIFDGVEAKRIKQEVPLSVLEDLYDVAVRQHKQIQKDGKASDWRLAVLDESSRFVDRQVAWTGNLISEFSSIIEKDDKKIDIVGTNAISLIPQYIGYTKRENEKTTPQEAFEQSSIIEITEKGKKIIENVVKINEICIRTNKPIIFKYTGKTMTASSVIGGTICISDETFGTLIDSFYALFYENLKHIIDIVMDAAVRQEEVYQCIFRVKDMRTDLRHDYEHGNNIDKKRRDIANCYKHYAGRPVLVQQKDYTTLQKKMYDEFLKLESHLMYILCPECRY